MIIKQIIYRSLFSIIAILCLYTPISAQEIINLTNIPEFYQGSGSVLHRDIHVMDGKIIVPFLKSYNAIFKYLPNVEVDSFDVPEDGSPLMRSSTLYAEYEPEVGFVDTDVINYGYYPHASLQDDKIGYARITNVLGINSKIVVPFPMDLDSLSIVNNIIAVYDKSLDSIIYSNIFSVDRWFYDMRNIVDGDYIYVNIPLSKDEDEDLYFMGDTLTYPFTMYGDHRNYLSKINYVTGEKEWTHMIGYGYLESMMMDDEGRINVVIEQPGPPSIDDELLIDLEDFAAGFYDHMIYRISQEGVPIDHTIIHTQNAPSIFDVEFNSDGSFQVFGDVRYPIHLIIQGDSLDLTDAMDVDATGFVAVFDKELNHLWSKRFKSQMRTIIKTMNKTPDGDFLVACKTQDDAITVDGHTYNSDVSSGEIDIFDYGSILMQFSPEGVLRGEPYFTNLQCDMEDMVCIADDHFLLLITCYNSGGELQFGEAAPIIRGSSFIEYKGDIFDIETTVNEYFLDNQVLISPNPVKAGNDISINISDDIKQKLQTIILTDSGGGRVQIHSMSNDIQLGRYLINSSLTSGMYFLTFKGETFVETVPLYIQN